MKIITSKGSAQMKKNLLFLEEYQLLNFIFNEDFKRKINNSKRDIVADPDHYYERWTRFNRKKARDINRLKEKFEEWIIIDFSMRTLMGDLENPEIRKKYPYIKDEKALGELLKIITQQSFKFILCLFEQYEIYNNNNYNFKDKK